MNPSDEALYRCLKKNSARITERWFQLRKKVKGSVYSIDAGTSVENMLKEQHALTIETVLSSLLDEQEIFRRNVDKWALTVAQSRVENEMPIQEVLEAFSRTRAIIWSFVEQYSCEQGETVTKEDILRWGSTFNSAFDTLNSEFSKAYYDLTKGRLTAQQELINELSSPMIPLTNTVAVLPLVGEINTNRAKVILEGIPGKCTNENIRHLFIDLSGVAFVDTMVAHQLYQLTDILRLLGIQSSISGIHPEVAQTSINLGFDFNNIKTYSTLKQALQQPDIAILPN